MNGGFPMSEMNHSLRQDGRRPPYETLLRCPICAEPFRLEGRSLICPRRHCFDLSWHGAVHLLGRPHLTKYDKRLFEARRRICLSGFYEPLSDAIVEAVAGIRPFGASPIRLLDAGCGEGYHLARIAAGLRQAFSTETIGAGVDIAKEGVALAAKAYPDMLWCVGDIAQCPFRDGRFDIVLNILSPSNYREFARMLKDGGAVVKVVPEAGYLQELREVLSVKPDSGGYSNERTIRLFASSFPLAERVRVRYTVPLKPSLLEPLIAMTPLTWGVSEASRSGALKKGLSAITVDLSILIGRKTRQRS